MTNPDYTSYTFKESVRSDVSSKICYRFVNRTDVWDIWDVTELSV